MAGRGFASRRRGFDEICVQEPWTRLPAEPTRLFDRRTTRCPMTEQRRAAEALWAVAAGTGLWRRVSGRRERVLSIG